jgi:hypothetical protein
MKEMVVKQNPFSWAIQKELDSEDELGVNSLLVGGYVVYEVACFQALPLPLCPLGDFWGFEPSKAKVVKQIFCTCHLQVLLLCSSLKSS